MKKWENFFIYVLIIGSILAIRLLIDFPPYILSLAESFLKIGQGIVEYFEMTDVVSVLQQIPVKVVFALMGIFHVLFGLIIYYFGKKKLVFGVTILSEQTIDVIKKGLILYGMIVALNILFVYSVLLLPLAGFLLIVLHFVVLVGKVPLSIYLGRLVVEGLHMEQKSIVCYGIGSVIMLLCESAYAVGNTFLCFVFPVLSLGVLLKLFLNHRIYGISNPVCEQKKEVFDRRKIRDIIWDKSREE